MILEWLCHSTKCQINKYLLDYVHSNMSVSCKNFTRLCVTVHWVVVLVHEVASLRRFPDISKDYSGFNFRVKQPKALQPFVCVWGGGGEEEGGCVALVGLNVTMSLATRLCLEQHCCEILSLTFCCIFGWAWVQVSTDTECLDFMFLWVSLCFRQILGWCLDLGHCHFQTLSTAFFTDRAVIWCCSVWAADSIVRKP